MLVVTMTGFQVGKGRFFAMLGFGTDATQKKYGKDYEAIRCVHRAAIGDEQKESSLLN